MPVRQVRILIPVLTECAVRCLPQRTTFTFCWQKKKKKKKYTHVFRAGLDMKLQFSQKLELQGWKEKVNIIYNSMFRQTTSPRDEFIVVIYFALSPKCSYSPFQIDVN